MALKLEISFQSLRDASILVSFIIGRISRCRLNENKFQLEMERNHNKIELS